VIIGLIEAALVITAAIVKIVSEHRHVALGPDIPM